MRARWERLGIEEIGDRPRAGSSSWQSLARGTGAIEMDYLNGEIALLGRLHGVPTTGQRRCWSRARRAPRPPWGPGSTTPARAVGRADLWRWPRGVQLSPIVAGRRRRSPAARSPSSSSWSRSRRPRAMSTAPRQASGTVRGAAARQAPIEYSSGPVLDARQRAGPDRDRDGFGHPPGDAARPRRHRDRHRRAPAAAPATATRLYGPGTADRWMGGVILAPRSRRGRSRATPEPFAELGPCCWSARTRSGAGSAPFVHRATVLPAPMTPACASSAGERTPGGEDGGGRAAQGRRHPEGGGGKGRASRLRAARLTTACNAAARALRRPPARIVELHDPPGPQLLSVVPTVIRSGDAFNVVPAAGELIFDLRARRAGGLRMCSWHVGRASRARRGQARRADGAPVAGNGLRGGDRGTAARRRTERSARSPDRASVAGGAAPATPATVAGTIALTVDGLGVRAAGCAHARRVRASRVAARPRRGRARGRRSRRFPDKRDSIRVRDKS